MFVLDGKISRGVLCHQRFGASQLSTFLGSNSVFNGLYDLRMSDNYVLLCVSKTTVFRFHTSQSVTVILRRAKMCQAN